MSGPRSGPGTVVVIGASGTLGQTLVAHFAAQGRRVVGTYARHPRDGLCPFDVREGRLDDVPVRWGPDVCAILCSAIANIDACKRDEALSEAVNVTGLVRVAADARERGARVVFCSSDYVFSGSKGGYVETDATCPITVYGEQKVRVETCLLATDPSALVVRLSRIITSDPGESSFLGGWYCALCAGRKIRIASDQFFCPTWAEDVAAGMGRLIDVAASGIYHLCQPRRYDRATLLRELMAHVGIPQGDIEVCRTEDFHFLDRRSLDVSMRPERFLQATGYRFPPMADGFRRFAERARRG